MAPRAASPERKGIEACRRFLRISSNKGRSLSPNAQPRAKGAPLGKEDCQYSKAWLDHCCRTVMDWQNKRAKDKKEKEQKKKAAAPKSPKKPRAPRKKKVAALAEPESSDSEASSAPSVDVDSSPSPKAK